MTYTVNIFKAYGSYGIMMTGTTLNCDTIK